MNLQESRTICRDANGTETDKNFQDFRDALSEWHPAALGKLVEHAVAAADEGFTAQGAAHPDLKRSVERARREIEEAFIADTIRHATDDDGVPGSDRDPPDIPDNHPLSGLEFLLDTHEGHLAAYAEVLADADPDEVDGAMVVLATAMDTWSMPTVSVDVEFDWMEVLLLAAHVGHVADRRQSDPVDVAKHAVHVLTEHTERGHEPAD